MKKNMKIRHAHFYEEDKPKTKRTRIIFIVSLIVLIAAAIGLILTLVLNNNTNPYKNGTDMVSATADPDTGLLPTIAIKGDPITSAEQVHGYWTLDGVTNYKFNDDGTGLLFTKSAQFAFTFTVAGSTMRLDFEDDTVTDVEYNCYSDGATLTLDDTATQRTYELIKYE